MPWLRQQLDDSDCCPLLGPVWPCSVPAIPSWWLRSRTRQVWLICSGDFSALCRVESGCRVIWLNSTRRKSTGQTRWDSWVENKAVGLGLYSLKKLYISLTMQRNSTAVTTVELHIDEEVDNDNKWYKWYERSTVRTVHGTNSLWYEWSIVRKVYRTSGPWYEWCTRGTNSPWYE